MIDTFSIKNFRSHKDVILKDCARVNILLGKNNAGKTAVLEAILIFCLPANPQYVLSMLNEQRGYKPEHESSELWDSYFNNWDHSQPIELKVEEGPRSLLILDKSLIITPLMGFSYSAVSNTIIEGHDILEKIQGLKFKAQSAEGFSEKKVTTLKKKTKRQVNSKVKESLERIYPIAFIPSKGIANPQEEAERFSRLEKKGEHHAVEAALKTVEPRLKRLTVIADGQGSMVYGDLGEGHLVPVPLMGEGMVRMLSIASAMANNKGGIVLIDEIENGLHYSVLTSLWEMIFKTAETLDVQVFAATHSDECLQAVSLVAQAQKAAQDLRLFRFDLRHGQTRVVGYNGDDLAVAIASEQEVR